MKKCKRCNETKELSGFSKRTSNSDGYNLVCKKCKNIEDKKREAQKKFDRQFEIF